MDDEVLVHLGTTTVPLVFESFMEILRESLSILLYILNATRRLK